MKIPQHTKIIKYYDWNKDVVPALDAKTGRDNRDWASMFRPIRNEFAPYQDFWHVMLDYMDTPRFSNGCYYEINFFDMREYYETHDRYSWAVEVIDHLIELFELKPYQEGDENTEELTFLFEW